MGRVLNRHKRGRRKKSYFAKVMPRLFVPLAAVGLLVGALYLLDTLGIV